MAANVQQWLFEIPSNVSATIPVNITWFSGLLHTTEAASFDFNLWLLKEDLPTNLEKKKHDPALLARSQNTFDNGFIWTPTIDDVDHNVPRPAIHQMAWERTDKNVDAKVSDMSIEGFSRGFRIFAPEIPKVSSLTTLPASTISEPAISTVLSTRSITPSVQITSTTGVGSSLGSASTSSPTTLPSSTLIAAANPSSSVSAVTQSTVVGLAVGLVLLFTALLFAGIFWWYRRRAAREPPIPKAPFQDMQLSLHPQCFGNEPPVERICPPVELYSERMVAELGSHSYG